MHIRLLIRVRSIREQKLQNRPLVSTHIYSLINATRRHPDHVPLRVPSLASPSPLPLPPLCSASVGDANVYTYVVGQKANKTIAFRVSRRALVLGPQVDEGWRRTDISMLGEGNCLGCRRKNTQLTSAAATLRRGRRNGARRKRNDRRGRWGKNSPRRYCLPRIYSSCSNSRLHFLHMLAPSAQPV